MASVLVMARAAAGLLAAIFLLIFSSLADAAPIVWSVDPAQGPLAIQVTLQNPFLGTRTGSGVSSLDGSLDGDLVDPLGPAPSVELAGSGLTLADTSFNVSLGGLFGSVTVSYDGVGASLSGGPTVGVPAGPGAWAVDLTGAALTLDQGAIHATHFIMSQTFDLAVDPVAFVFGPTAASLFAIDLGGGLVGLELLVPLDVTATLDPIAAPIVGNVTATVRMTGALRMTATATLPPPVPEPGTALLLATGLTGLLVAGRTRR
jgi:hypothetical protein